MNSFDIFKSCFTQFKFNEEIFNALSKIDRCKIISHEIKGKTVGFAAVFDDNIRLLCVLPEYRRQGIGSSLLKRAEEHIFSQGHDRAVIGGTSSHLFIGAVSDSSDFFEKRGYELSENIAEMCLDTENFTESSLSLNGPNGVTFGWYNGDTERLKTAVAKVEDDWVQYFTEDEHVFCGYADGEIASFCMAGDRQVCLLSDGLGNIGSIGCVGTVPEYRRKGIGLKMVALAAEELKKQGCRKIFIHYTHVYDWYAKLGARTFLFVKLGEKKLPCHRDHGKGYERL